MKKISVDAKPSTKKVNVRVVKNHRTPFGCMFIRNKDVSKFMKAVRG